MPRTATNGIARQMLTDPLDDLLTQPEYARFRRCSERTAERERATGRGCRFIKIGRAVRYRRRDIIEFIEKHVRQSTSEAAPTAAAPGNTAHQRSRLPERNRQPRQSGIAPEPRPAEDEVPF